MIFSSFFDVGCGPVFGLDFRLKIRCRTQTSDRLNRGRTKMGTLCWFSLHEDWPGSHEFKKLVFETGDQGKQEKGMDPLTS